MGLLPIFLDLDRRPFFAKPAFDVYDESVPSRHLFGRRPRRNGKDLVIAAVAGCRAGGKYLERPRDCLLCGSPAWWNGTRLVSSVGKTADGIQHEANQVRRRARCSSKTCRWSWT